MQKCEAFEEEDVQEPPGTVGVKSEDGATKTAEGGNVEHTPKSKSNEMRT